MQNICSSCHINVMLVALLLLINLISQSIYAYNQMHTSEPEVIEYCYVCSQCQELFFVSSVAPESDIELMNTAETSLCSKCMKSG